MSPLAFLISGVGVPQKYRLIKKSFKKSRSTHKVFNSVVLSMTCRFRRESEFYGYFDGKSDISLISDVKLTQLNKSPKNLVMEFSRAKFEV